MFKSVSRSEALSILRVTSSVCGGGIEEGLTGSSCVEWDSLNCFPPFLPFPDTVGVVGIRVEFNVGGGNPASSYSFFFIVEFK